MTEDEMVGWHTAPASRPSTARAPNKASLSEAPGAHIQPQVALSSCDSKKMPPLCCSGCRGDFVG